MFQKKRKRKIPVDDRSQGPCNEKECEAACALAAFLCLCVHPSQTLVALGDSITICALRRLGKAQALLYVGVLFPRTLFKGTNSPPTETILLPMRVPAVSVQTVAA